MPLQVNNDSTSLSVQRNLDQSQKALKTAFARISSALRINSASDNAADLAVSVDIATRIQGLSQAERNANDAISTVQVADGALEEAQNILQRARELSVQAANGTNSATDRQAIQSEINQLQQQFNDLSETSFNGVQLFNQGTSLEFQVGDEANQTTRVDFSNSLTAPSLDVTTASGAQDAIQAIDAALENVTTDRASLGAVQSQFESTVRSLGSQRQNQAESLSRIQDADIAKEAADVTKNQILSKAGIAVAAQANASKKDTLSLLTGIGG